MVALGTSLNRKAGDPQQPRQPRDVTDGEPEAAL
ncbi:hypothetical protein VDGD_21751 [Verticillium dahliae]|nr:hypothetical protein VDGD_21751 [Verticillium dahliae]